MSPSNAHNLDPLRVTWLDSARIVRRAWPEQYGKSGWGLKNVATDLDIVFSHHDALEDARAAAEIVLRACTATETGIADWLHLVNRPIFPPSDRAAVSRPEANPDGSLYGETILFTGELSVPRREASELAAQAGCNVVDNASKKVTMLVIGTQGGSKLKGYEKSSKHRKIEALISKGAGVDILSESDFFELLGINRSEIVASAKSPPPSAKKGGSGVVEEDWEDIGEGDADENNVGLIVRINLDVMPDELVKEGRKVELPTEEALEALRKAIEDLEGDR